MTYLTIIPSWLGCSLFCKIHESSIGVKVVEGDKKMEDSPFYNHDVVEISNTGTQYVVLQNENTREAVYVKND